MIPTLWTRGTVTSPFDSVWGMRREVDRLLDGLNQLSSGEQAMWSAPTEVHETSDAIRFAIELPGMRPEDVEVTIENNVLMISGEKKFERQEGKEEGEYRLFERRYGRFTRSFTVPPTVDPNRIQANFEDGVLKVVLPKTEEAKPRRIQVGGGASRRIESHEGDQPSGERR